MADGFSESPIHNETTNNVNANFIDELNSFFIDSSSAIYGKLHTLGSCQIKYGDRDEIFNKNDIKKFAN